MQKLLTKRKRKKLSGLRKSSKVVSVLFQSMSQVKLKLTDDFNTFLGLLLAVHWQLDIAVI